MRTAHYNAKRRHWPHTATEMNQAMGGYGTWASAWLLDEASGTFADKFGAVTLTAAGTPGTPTAATRGFTLDNTYRCRKTKTTVRWKLAVRGSMSAAATTGNVKLMDTAGNSYGPVAVNSNVEGWFTGDVDLPNDDRKYDLQFASNGVNTLAVKAVSLYELDI